MEQIAIRLTPRDHAMEMARWYYELAKLCVHAAEEHVELGENSPLEDVDRALAINELIRVRMATVQSAERVFRSEFRQLYIDHHVERTLLLDSGAAAN